MPHPALAGAEVALPEPPHQEGAAAGPAGGDLPHIVTAYNASAGTTGTSAVDQMCCQPGVLVAMEGSLILEAVSCAVRESGG